MVHELLQLHAVDERDDHTNHTHTQAETQFIPRPAEEFGKRRFLSANGSNAFRPH